MVASAPHRASPLQNRVTPFGEIVAIPERGTMMGNRGILHDGEQRVRRAWAGRLWICCVLDFQGRHDPVMAPGHYTRLFFLDEPTALAAGHRPCAYCRRDEYRIFRDAWARGNPEAGLGTTPRAADIDRVLHGERLAPGGTKRLHPAHLDGLPDGVFVTARPPHDRPEPAIRTPIDRTRLTRERSMDTRSEGNQQTDAYLVWRGAFWRWTPSGYQPATDALDGAILLLTPPSIAAALAHGFVPRPPAGLT